MKDYEVFLSAGVGLVEDVEIELNLRDAETLENFDARVILSHDFSRLESPDNLWIRRENVGDVRREPKPYAVRILERHAEPVEEVQIAKKDVPLAERQGWMLRSLLERGDESGGSKPG